MNLLTKTSLFLLGLAVQASVLFASVVRIDGNRILQDDVPVKVIGLRCSNALLNDASANDLIMNLDLYQDYGLNAVSVFLMGSRFGDIKGYLADGSMDPVYRDRLERILNETQSRNMLMIVGCLYWSTSRARDDLAGWTQEDADRAIANTARWLAEKGYRHVILDPDNEGMAGRAMNWETESMVIAAKAANPHIPVANNTRKSAPSADLNMHFGPKDPAKPYLDSESTPGESHVSSYWGKFSKESHQENPSYYNYSRIGRYTEEMKQSQIAKTRDLVKNYNGILLASTWLQCGSKEGVGGPFAFPGGRSDLGSGSRLSAEWNRNIDTLHPEAGVLWWLEFIREYTGSGIAK